MNQYGFYVCVSKMFIGLSIVLLRRNPVLGLYNKEEYVSYLKTNSCIHMVLLLMFGLAAVFLYYMMLFVVLCYGC